MKLGPITKLDKRNKTTSKKVDNDALTTNDIIVIFPVDDQFGANQKFHFGLMVYNSYISINSNFLSSKNC